MSIEVRKPTAAEIAEAENWGEWEKEVSEFPWSYDEKETCLILEGHAVFESADGEKDEFGAGDWVVFPVGTQGTWKIDKAIRKKYNFG